ncbi:Uncharacterised protein [Elizabethkingia miricola]|uniref:Uncharacterized protein n=1 Tax=Elizabethkingia miricola TaxID=172045 RepID=A0ABD4DQS9_ELIMR|nr:hypothetical protein [Elizabethkingia miricola]KUY20860.1 hypothetical protein ATB95_08160 [Elizabethkingia miricola]MCL1652928.1 hypothetical protein [Elizabethkingia miricola]SPW34237.1 Uncharacterised protein [Elizabethkingia miricola]
MSGNQIAQTKTNEVAQQSEDIRLKMQNFTQALNKEPASGVDSTPDGKAKTINISHIEMTLDEMFFGAWSTENFKWTVIQNEVVGSLDLVVLHPSSGMLLRRVGADIDMDTDMGMDKDKAVESREKRKARILAQLDRKERFQIKKPSKRRKTA